MRIYLATLASIVMAFQAKAQFDIQVIQPAGKQHIADSATIATIPTALTGPGVTWDCSNLLKKPGTPDIEIGNWPPAGTPYATDYPFATMALTDPPNDSFTGYGYHSIDSLGDSLVFWGNRKPGAAYAIYDDPELVLPFPFSYNQTVTNSYSLTNYDAQGNSLSSQTGTVTLSYEAYGTLKLPAGTYLEVAKVKRIRTNSLGPTTTSYVWYQLGTGLVLLSYNAVNNNEVIYKRDAVASVRNFEEAEKITCATEASTVHLKSEFILKNIDIQNLTGQKVFSLTNPNQYHVSINLQNLTTGTYIIRAKTEKTNHSFKVMIQ